MDYLEKSKCVENGHSKLEISTKIKKILLKPVMSVWIQVTMQQNTIYASDFIWWSLKTINVKKIT